VETEINGSYKKVSLLVWGVSVVAGGFEEAPQKLNYLSF